MVRILVHHLTNLEVIQKFPGILAQMQNHRCTLLCPLNGFHGKLTLAIAFPAHPGGDIGTGLAAFHGYPVSNNERGIKAYTKLADQLGVLLLVTAERGEEFFGAGTGDGTQVLDHVFLVHANSVIGDGESARFLVYSQADSRVVS